MSDQKQTLKWILIGIIWVPLYLDVTDRLFYRIFRFSPLTWSDWQAKAVAFGRSEWVIQSEKDWLLLLGMVSFLPLLFLGWYILYHLQWNRFWHHHSPVVIAPSRPQIPEKKSFKPAEVRIQSAAVMSASTASPASVQSPATAPTPSSAPTTPTYPDEGEVQQMVQLTSHVPADFFPHVNLDGAYASFALSTEKRAAIVRIINRPESTFAVDIEVPINESDWFYETGTIPTPAKDIIAIAKNLHENEPDSTALPVVLLMGGTLLNIDETLDYFEKNDVLLLRTEAVDADSIPLFTDFLQEYFPVETTQPASSDTPAPPVLPPEETA